MTTTPADHERIVMYEARAAAALSDANEARERLRWRTAEQHDARAQRWLDRANELRGWS